MAKRKLQEWIDAKKALNPNKPEKHPKVDVEGSNRVVWSSDPELHDLDDYRVCEHKVPGSGDGPWPIEQKYRVVLEPRRRP